jgi:hypothetical protein
VLLLQFLLRLLHRAQQGRQGQEVARVSSSMVIAWLDDQTAQQKACMQMHTAQQQGGVRGLTGHVM